MRVTQVDIDWHEDLSVFASEPFLKAVGDEYGWLGGVGESGCVRCILPFTILRKSIFRLVRFRVETQLIDKQVSVEEEREFLNQVASYFRDRKQSMIIPATTNTIFRVFPEGAAAAPYGTYIIDLTQDLETIWARMSASHRRKVRRAEKSGVIIRQGSEYLGPVYEAIRDTFRRSRQGFMDYASFQRQVSSLGEKAKLFVAEYNGVIQGGMMTPFSQKSAYYVYGGSIPSPAYGAMHLMHWRAVQEFHRLGVKAYDFVGVRIDPPTGSKQEGLAAFKQRFGGELVRGYMWKYPFNPLKYSIYQLAVRLSRGGDIVDQEQPKLQSVSLGTAN